MHARRAALVRLVEPVLAGALALGGALDALILLALAAAGRLLLWPPRALRQPTGLGHGHRNNRVDHVLGLNRQVHDSDVRFVLRDGCGRVEDLGRLVLPVVLLRSLAVAHERVALRVHGVAVVIAPRVGRLGTGRAALAVAKVEV
eukprot:scaffold9928_cov63-Phaeocystis_antarctica.AAC.5